MFDDNSSSKYALGQILAAQFLGDNSLTIFNCLGIISRRSNRWYTVKYVHEKNITVQFISGQFFGHNSVNCRIVRCYLTLVDFFFLSLSPPSITSTGSFYKINIKASYFLVNCLQRGIVRWYFNSLTCLTVSLSNINLTRYYY